MRLVSKATILRRLLKSDDILVAPSAYDALSARVIEAAGFEAIGTTGQGISASLLGMPDVSLLSFHEALICHRNIANAVSVPVMADGDTGYGDVINVIRTVKEFEKAGVAGIYLEDQESPKKCGSLAGREVVSREDGVAKIKAAVESRNDPDFLIVARTDADCISIDEAVERGNAYAEAGADIIKPQPHSTEELQIYARSIRKPLHIGTGIGKSGARWSISELRGIGNIKIATFPLSACYAATFAMMNLMNTIRETGSVARYDGMTDFEEFQRLLGLPRVYELEEKYLGRRRGQP